MSALLLFLKSCEPLLLGEFDAALIPELQSLAAGAKSPDVAVILNALVAMVKAIGDAELPKV